MFIPHCHLFDSFFGNGHALQDSMRLVSAFAIEAELQDSRRRELEQTEDERDRNTKNPNDNP
jgi:hypothetical protein